MDNLEALKNKVIGKLNDSPIFFIVNDPERALGLEKIIPNYHIIHIDKSYYPNYFQLNKIKYYCWQDNVNYDLYRNSYHLLKSKEFEQYLNINKSNINYFQTFKISPAFEKKVIELNGILLNTSGELNRKFEDKISQFNELSKISISMPKGEIIRINDIDYDKFKNKYGEKLVLQFDRGHTGSGTVFINNNEELINLKNKFPNRNVKLSEYIDGEAYTLNAVVGKNGIYIGGLSKQITGVLDLTINLGGTVGNDFHYRKDIKDNEKLNNIINDVKKIGTLMRESGYKGLFGIDLIIDNNSNHKIIEINARQPASIPMFTKIQLKNNQIPLSLIHLAEFLGVEYDIDEQEYNNTALAQFEYSQIFIRSFKDFKLNYPIKMGVYRLQGDNAAINRVTEEVREDTIFTDEDRDKALLFQKEAYTIDDIENGGILVLVPSKGKNIKINEEIGRIQINSSAHDENGRLYQWIIDSLVAIKNYQS